jgi:hypothetical protein
MEEHKPQSIRTVGLIVAIFSGFIIFSNAMGILAFALTRMSSPSPLEEANSRELLQFILDHYAEICVFMVGVGIIYLLGAINIRKYRRWARKLVSAISLFLIIFISTTMLALFTAAEGTYSLSFFRFAAIATALIWTAVLGLLVWFLNQEKIKKHFV